MSQVDANEKLYLTWGAVQLATGFSLDLLALLAEADVRVRVCADMDERLNDVRLFETLADEARCLRAPFAFPSPASRYAYLSGRNICPGQELYDDRWGPVILMCGLPGTGKDTYVRANFPNLPMVSLDEFRARMRIAPTQPQGAVANAAKETAREYLRARMPFVWNATNVTPQLRAKQIALFERYGASVRVIYLETDLGERARRNQSRAAAVPEGVITRMLRSLAPPLPREAQIVEWISV